MINIKANICLIRAKVYESLENVKKSIIWYKTCIKYDIKCVEAFFHLIDNRMLSMNEELELINGILQFDNDTEWLKLIFQHKISQYTYGTNNNILKIQNLLENIHDNLKTDINLKVGIAIYLYNINNYHQSYLISKQIMEDDPYNEKILSSYICCLVELNLKSQLFYTAHQLIQSDANKVIAWYAVACYYYLIKKYDISRKFFKMYYYRYTFCISLDWLWTFICFTR